MQSNEPPVSPAFDDDVNAVVDRGVNRAPEGSPQVAPEGNAPAQAFEDKADAFGGSLTGRRIAHYVVEEKMGGGAMATVYRAHDTILDRMVALKVLMPRWMKPRASVFAARRGPPSPSNTPTSSRAIRSGRSQTKAPTTLSWSW